MRKATTKEIARLALRLAGREKLSPILLVEAWAATHGWSTNKLQQVKKLVGKLQKSKNPTQRAQKEVGKEEKQPDFFN